MIKLIILIISLISLIEPTEIFAQAAAIVTAPKFLISWQANSYVPWWYQGKIFPTRGSRVEVAFELIDNGKITDISKNKVRWYVNDKLVLNERNGLGIKNYSFRVFDYPGQDIEIRISIPEYKDGEEAGGMIIIPIAHSEAVLDAPYPGRKINTGFSSFSAYPFFFNISDLNQLSFQWSTNGQAAQADINQPQKLDLNIDAKAPSGFEINSRLRIQNLKDEINFANSEMRFKIK